MTPNKITVWITGFFFLLCGITYAESPNLETVRAWNFSDSDAAKDWAAHNYLENISIENGVYRATVSGNDPFIISPVLDFSANGFQYVEIRLKTNSSGQGEIFFTGSLDGPYGGFSQQKTLNWTAYGDNKWHTYRLYPDWIGEKTIKRIRIDFPVPVFRDGEKPTIAIESIRILQPKPDSSQYVTPDWDFFTGQAAWNPAGQTTTEKTDHGLRVASSDEISPAVETALVAFDDTENNAWLSLEMNSENAAKTKIEWACDTGKVGTFVFPMREDGNFHWYNIDISKRKISSGKTHWLKITLGENGSATGVIKRLLLTDKPQGPADITVEKIWFSEPINRVGTAAPLSIWLKNHGGQTETDLKFGAITTLNFMTARSEYRKPVPPVEPMKTVTHKIFLTPKSAGEAMASVVFHGKSISSKQSTASVNVYPDLQLPQADYVPQPKPVRSDFEIGAYYFPGWSTAKQWQRILSTHPERKPVLGWYDEANPEVIDWQIKWAVENGLQYFLVDWYWSRGRQQLDHWVNGFQKAKYKSYLKWAVMWANHNGPGSHSEEDQKKVTQFWIDHYFNTPEYYTIDSMPVVVIWSPSGMDDDVIALERAKGNELKKGEGVKKLLDLSRKMAKDAGYQGIYFIAMKWPEASTDAKDIQWLADAGFDMTSIYHYMDHGGKAENPMRFSFDLVRDANPKHWQGRHKSGILPFLPNVSTGWDSRPWHGDENIIIEDRTVGKFRHICDEYVKFANETGIKRFALGPLNEWGEGSYIEPNLEYGFEMYETLREVFCEKPAEGWPLNYAPSDVGLGPYDLSGTETP